MKEKILSMIERGESNQVEFKEEDVTNRDLAKEVVAFANTDGGTILIGVGDDGVIKGIDDNFKIEERMMNICRDSCYPPIIPLFHTTTIEGKNIVLLDIPKGMNKPYYTLDNKYYIRVGTTKRPASREELLRLFERAGSLHFDISPIVGTTIKDLYVEAIRDYFLYYNAFDLLEEPLETRIQILKNSDILTDKDHAQVCTVGGLLIFGLHPEKNLPQNGVSFAHFQGDHLTDALIDKKNISGRLPIVAEQLMTIIKNNLLNPSVVEGMKRKEQEGYPMIVLREAVINALVHRDYSIRGSKIRVFMFSDRIEIRSPGRLPNTVTTEKMKIGVSYARNPFLVKYMENLRYIDHLGRGVPMILQKMHELGAKEPLLVEQGEEFILTIYRP